MRPLIYQISRWLVAILFLFSGFTKAVNPFGLSVQFVDYFTALNLEFMHPLAPLCALLLPTLEMLLGVLLILGLYRKLVGWVTLLVMSFFTVLTLWIALESPVSDCGCFGDIFIISNWATFYKNLAFMLPTVIVFLGRFGQGRVAWGGWRIGVVLFLVLGMLPLYCYNNLPLIDGTPFKRGVNIYEAMRDGVTDKTETSLIYRDRATGETKEFSLSSTEWQDSQQWEFVDSRTVVLEQGRESTVREFPIIDSNGNDVAEELLQNSGNMAFIVAVNPAKQSEAIALQISKLRDLGVQNIVLLHSTIQEVIMDGVSVYTTDNSILKTIIQSPVGGVLILSKGTILDKWAM